MRTIPVDLILHELVTRLAELPDTQHRDLHRAISNGCIRPQILAEEWTHGAGAAQQAAWLVRRLDGDIGKPASLPVTAGPGMSVVPTGQMVAAETRAMEVAVARRLADCALSLLVTQDAEGAATAQTLMQAAQRVVGLATAKPSAEAALFTSATDGADDGLSPATLRRYLAATRDALGLGSGPVFLGDIVTRAKSLADANEAHRASEANKASIIAKQEKTIANLKSAALVGVAGVIADALHLEAKPGDSDPSTLSRRCVEAIEHLQATVDARAEERDVATRERLKVARDCLPPGVDIIACLRDDKPTTYKASNTGEEYDTPEAAARAAWEHHMRPSQSVPDRAFKVGDIVRFARIKSGEGYWKSAPPLGWEGEITDIDESNLPIRVSGPRWSDSHVSQGWWFTAADLDLVTPTA